MFSWGSSALSCSLARQDGADLFRGHGEVSLAVLGQVALAEQPEQAVGGLIHDPDDGPHHGVESLDDPGHRQAHGHRLVKGQHLRRQLAADYVQEGDDDEGQDIGEGVGPLQSCRPR